MVDSNDRDPRHDTEPNEDVPGDALGPESLRNLAESMRPDWDPDALESARRDWIVNRLGAKPWTRDDVKYLLESTLDCLSHRELHSILEEMEEDGTFLVVIRESLETTGDGWCTRWTLYDLWLEKTLEFVDTVFDWYDFSPRRQTD